MYSTSLMPYRSHIESISSKTIVRIRFLSKKFKGSFINLRRHGIVVTKISIPLRNLTFWKTENQCRFNLNKKTFSILPEVPYFHFVRKRIRYLVYGLFFWSSLCNLSPLCRHLPNSHKLWSLLDHHFSRFYRRYGPPKYNKILSVL